jgi:Ras-related protein Rab-23
MLEEDVEISMKVIVVGNGCVGKSSLIRQYGYGSFTDEYKKTIGVDFVERQIELVGDSFLLAPVPIFY